jgi:hypothetical protein
MNWHNNILIVLLLLLMEGLLLSAIHDAVYSSDDFCTNTECRTFEKLYDSRQYHKITELADPKAKYTEDTILFIGRSFMILSDEDTLPFEQKEKMLYQAIEFGYYPAFMGLYNLYADKDPKKALDFVKVYAATKPEDPDPYFALGEAAFQKNDYQSANAYLRRSSELSSGHTAGIDWLLFKTNYILRNYQYSAEILDSALAQGDFTKEINELKKDRHFRGIEKRPEFKEFRGWFQSK